MNLIAARADFLTTQDSRDMGLAVELSRTVEISHVLPPILQLGTYSTPLNWEERGYVSSQAGQCWARSFPGYAVLVDLKNQRVLLFQPFQQESARDSSTNPQAD